MTSNDADLLTHATALLRTAAAELDGGQALGKGAVRWAGREPKAPIDRQLDQIIVEGLKETGIPILSEESNQSVAWWSSSRTWIVDPLDGTLNFVRGTGPSAVSICLWDGKEPVFGALLDIGSGEIFWGGKTIGAMGPEGRLTVSDISEPRTGVLCTGIPASFDFSDQCAVAQWVHVLASFGKVRMLGSAASMLLMVAKGAADCYYEGSIRIWDIAAGIALVEGAGGSYRIVPGQSSTAVTAIVSNAAMANAVRQKIFRAADE